MNNHNHNLNGNRKPPLFTNLDPKKDVHEIPDPIEHVSMNYYAGRVVLYYGGFFKYTSHDRAEWNRHIETNQRPNRDRCLGALFARLEGSLPERYWQKVQSKPKYKGDAPQEVQLTLGNGNGPQAA